MRHLFVLLAASVLAVGCSSSDRVVEESDGAAAVSSYDSVAHGKLPTVDGFRGIWYSNQPSGDKYRFKYSGGMATFPQQHYPIAVYAEEVNKTFFVYGGRPVSENRLLHMISYYDHETDRVARPRVLLDKKTDDAHDNPTFQIDDRGHLWVFSNAHGTARPSYIHRSQRPYSIEAFEQVRTTNFSYAQPWFLPGEGFVLLHTLYQEGRKLHVSRSSRGQNWSEPKLLAAAGEGHYQISQREGARIGTVFNYHPPGKEGSGLNWRTNLYYMETTDGGRTWQNVEGEPIELPLVSPKNRALALEYESKNRLVYLKNMAYTDDGEPVILYLTSRGYRSGPENDPRLFRIAHWNGVEWKDYEVTDADNNYDYATLFTESDSTWRVIGTTEPGPQAYNTGGEMAIWVSHDRGETWSMEKQLTQDSRYNHTYPRRPVNAHPDFYLLWADGHGREVSESRLYFTNKEGTNVWRLPGSMEDSMAAPVPVW